jgi:hypothetical protein
VPPPPRDPHPIPPLFKGTGAIAARSEAKAVARPNMPGTEEHAVNAATHSGASP